jgi:hypothetical protein
MAISDEKRSALSGLALQALDVIEEQYGDEAELGDAVIVFEVLTPDLDEPETGPINHGHYRATTNRTSIALGMIEMAKACMLQPVERTDD